MERKLKITNAKQFQTLISELEKNPTLAKGFHRLTTPNTFKQDWEEIAIKLNSFGPPVRDSEGWLKVWRDFKFKVKKKLSKVVELDASGRKKYKHLILHPLEESVANLMQLKTHLYNDTAVLEIKAEETEIRTENVYEIKTEVLEQPVWDDDEDISLGNQSVEEEIKTENYCMIDQTILGDEEEMPSSSLNSVGIQKIAAPDRRKRKRSRNNDERQELLQQHNAMQEKVFNEIAYTMMEIKNILKDTSRYKQKLLEVEEKKLKIMELQNERDEQLFESEMRIKMLEMKIKTKQLQDLEKKSTD